MGYKDKYPFKTIPSDKFSFRILLSGYYHVIYVDKHKDAKGFQIDDRTNGTTLFTTKLDYTDDFTPFTINTVINVQTHNGFGHSDIRLRTITDTSILKGKGYNTFYIKYLHS